MTAKPPWSFKIALGTVGRDPVVYDLAADEAERARIARLLDLAELNALTARVTVAGWFDGVQACGITLEPLPSNLSNHFMVRVVPAGSPHAPELLEEVAVDLQADDPPDVAETSEIDLAAYVVEHLALDIEPFPRKPGAEFVAPEISAEISPFAVLRRLQDKDER
jgi:hypothetical protein